jgi:hypothetical protein
VIVARYPGECPECGEDIEPGDMIESDSSGDDWRHVECPSITPLEKAVANTCPKCYQVRAANGTCGCE